MRAAVLALLALSALSCAEAPPPASAPDPAPASGAAVPLREPTPAVPERSPLDALDAPVPADVTVALRREDADRFTVRVERRGHVVALRLHDARATGDGAAELPDVARGAPGSPIVWEATDPATLVTTRGLVELDPAGEPRLRLTAAPREVASDTTARHACRAHEDGAGGVAVLCRVSAFATVERLTRASPKEGVWVAPGFARSLLRVDLDARAGAADAAAIGYTDGLTGFVVRAELSRVAGEASPAVVIQSAERVQPSFGGRGFSGMGMRRMSLPLEHEL